MIDKIKKDLEQVSWRISHNNEHPQIKLHSSTNYEKERTNPRQSDLYCYKTKLVYLVVLDDKIFDVNSITRPAFSIDIRIYENSDDVQDNVGISMRRFIKTFSLLKPVDSCSVFSTSTVLESPLDKLKFHIEEYIGEIYTCGRLINDTNRDYKVFMDSEGTMSSLALTGHGITLRPFSKYVCVNGEKRYRYGLDYEIDKRVLHTLFSGLKEKNL